MCNYLDDKFSEKEDGNHHINKRQWVAQAGVMHPSSSMWLVHGQHNATKRNDEQNEGFEVAGVSHLCALQPQCVVLIEAAESYCLVFEM